MEAKKAPIMVKEMFAEGEVSLVDPKTLYRYSLTAPCPGTVKTPLFSGMKSQATL